MLEEFAKIREEKVTEEEFTRGKEYLKGRFTLELEDSRSVAALFATSEVIEGKIRTPEEIIRKIDEVTVEDIQSVAKDIFRQEVLNLAIIGPYKNAERFQNLLKLT